MSLSRNDNKEPLKPKGIKMKFYNTLTRTIEDFVPIEKGRVKLYSCGPTVYDRAHVGNLRSFLFVDLLKRWLEFNGFSVMHVMNLTDVDDKTIKRSRQKGISLHALTDEYSKAFFEDLGKLGIKSATVYSRATEHISEMVDLIKRLLSSGHAYKKDGSVYYRIASFPSYGQLARLDVSGMKAGASGVDVDEYGKDDVRDFVLWKAHKPKEDGEVFWDTEIGRGRPGWHIECSAMSMKYLGQTFDIHTGGVDLIFPHHQNEIAQSEGATGQPFVNYWLHSGHLLFRGEKMAKSVGTVRYLDDIAKTRLEVSAFRYLILAHHYRMELNFTEQSLNAAKHTIERLQSFRSSLRSVNSDGGNQIQDLIMKTETAFNQALNQDLGTPQALAAMFDLISTIERNLGVKNLTTGSAAAVLGFLDSFDSIFGVFALAESEAKIQEEARPLDPEIEKLIDERTRARENKDWRRADEIRNALLKQGIKLADTEKGTRWERF